MKHLCSQIVIETPQVLPNPSPRGKSTFAIDEGTEMKTFNVSSFNQHAKKAHDEQYDEAVDVISDDDIGNVAVHERLFGMHNSSGFTSMDAEDDEEYEEFSAKRANQALGGERTGSRYTGSSIEMPVKGRDYYSGGGSPVQTGCVRPLNREVDASVTFPLADSPVRHYGAMCNSKQDGSPPCNRRTSEGTNIQTDITPREPPFGHPLDADSFYRSAERLRSGAYGSKSSPPPPSNMPLAEPVRVSPIRSLEEGMATLNSLEKDDKANEQSGTNNRKKKKKKKNKGEFFFRT